MIQKIILFLRNNWALIAVAFFFFFGSFYNINKQGLIGADEGHYIAVLHTFSDLLRNIIFHPSNIVDFNFYSDLIKNYGAIYTAAKPSFILPAAVIDFFYPSLYSARIVSAVSGFLVLVVFYKLLDLFFIKKEFKFISLLCLATSPLLLAHARLGLPSTAPALFLLSSVYSLLRFFIQTQSGPSKNTRWLLWSGFFASLSFMSHYSSLLSVTLIVISGFYLLYRYSYPWINYLYFILSFVFIPFAWELCGRVMVFVVRAKGIAILDKDNQVLTYFQEIIEQMRRSQIERGFNLNNFFSYFQFFLSSEGILISIIILLGFVVAFKLRQDRRYVFLLLFTVISLLFISLAAFTFSRILVPLLPFLYIFAALSLTRIKSLTITVLVVVAIMASRGLSLWKVVNATSNTKELSSLVQNYPATDVVIFGGPPSNLRAHLWHAGYEIEGLPLNIYEAKERAGNKQKAFFVVDTINQDNMIWLYNYNPVLVAEYHSSADETLQFAANSGIPAALDNKNKQGWAKIRLLLVDLSVVQ